MCAKNGKYIKWYLSDGKNQQVISKKDIEFAITMAAKKYFLLLYNDLSHEKTLLDHYLSKHIICGKAEQLLTSSTEFSRLLQLYFKPKSPELEQWMESSYHQYDGYPEHLVHETLPNVFVRSKSEAIIYMSLLHHSIPFHYEEILVFENLKFYPDFTIRHPKTGKYFYWEHFGKMDGRKYQRRTFSKLEDYASCGVYPTINLITTFETSENPLTFDKVERIIEEYFL